MAVGQEVLRYVGGSVGPEADGWIIIIEGDAYVKLVGNSTITGNVIVTGDLSATGTFSVPRVTSTIATGTAPLTVASTTVVPNLNADLLDGLNASDFLLKAGDTLATGSLTLTAGTLGFGSATRQMLNLFSTTYAIGVQSSTSYARTGGNFAWYLNGSHATTAYDAGGGTELMRLSTTEFKYKGGDIYHSGNLPAMLPLTGGTLTGGLTINGSTDAGGSNFSNLVLGPLATAGEGGQITYKGNGANPDWHTDVLNANLRAHTGGLVRLNIANTGRVTIPPTDSGQNISLMIDGNAGVSNRAAIGYNGVWEMGNDFAQNGTNDFYLWHSTAGRIFGVASDGTFVFMDKFLTFPNAGAIMGVDTGGVQRLAMHPRYTDDNMYLDGGAGIILRTNNGLNTVMTLSSDGYARTRNQRIFHGAMGSTQVTFAGTTASTATIAHGLGIAPTSVVASSAHTFGDGGGVYNLAVSSWDATNITFRALSAASGTYNIAGKTLVIHWMAGLY